LVISIEEDGKQKMTAKAMTGTASHQKEVGKVMLCSSTWWVVPKPFEHAVGAHAEEAKPGSARTLVTRFGLLTQNIG
jgi:hypothetical protein